ncbi:MAG: ArsR/SmtB family transcription factor [Fimbriimonadales bacterium]
MEDKEEALEEQTLAGGFRSHSSGFEILSDLANGSENKFAAELLTSLAHATRVRIVNLLRKEPLSVSQITAGLQISQANASQHLAVLLRSGALARASNGTTRLYSLRDPSVAKVLDIIEEFRQAHREDLAAELVG